MSGQALVAVFLDMAALASGPGRTVKMHLPNVDQLIAYAKAYRRVVRTCPQLVRVYPTFKLPSTINVAAIASDIDRVLAIFRGTYLSALDKVNTSDIGGVCIDLPTRDNAEMAYWSCHTEAYEGYVYQLVTEFHWWDVGTRTRQATLYKDALAPPPDIPSVEDKMAALTAFEEGAMAALTMDESDGE
ncbi:hypothetical protein QFC20_001952 [Naganishia adeliensis]|uniref:Uncharacterized protein n=1 Tax=Naganishia adeliensis TaxID=92952 RepID=A0ACC2WQN7_9TREE|nr:hypothetical protein QFC20_001952 [Naganishia adeliensis]